MAPLFEGELESWPDSVKERTEYSINTIDYSQLPQDLIEEWKRWYKPCGSFRLLTPMLLGQKVRKKYEIILDLLKKNYSGYHRCCDLCRFRCGLCKAH